jgi:hypothetical protein
LSKIDKAFAARLQKLNPDQMIRAVVLLNLSHDKNEPLGSTKGGQRSSAAEAVTRQARESLSSVDLVLREHGGHRLSENPNLLGAIAVEATRDSIHALASSDDVRAVLEDQPLSLIR